MVGLIILAAGASSRMGTPKQLLPYKGQSLIRHVVTEAIASVCDPVLVVLGANGDRIQPELASLEVQVIENPAWAAGMSTSIRAGISVLLAHNPDTSAVVIMVGDQPLIACNLINQLVHCYQTGNWLIVASKYAGILGVPALFHHTLFAELMVLQGDTGARKVIQAHSQNTLGVACPQAVVDLDTPTDYQQLLSAQSSINTIGNQDSVG